MTLVTIPMRGCFSYHAAMPNRLRNNWILLIAVSIGAFACGAGPVAAKTNVVIGQLSWTGAEVIAAVLGQVLREDLHANVSTITATESALYESLNKGDGSVDIVPDMWTDHLGQQMKNYVLPGSKESILLNKQPYFGTEGIYIPTYVAEKYHIRNLADLAKPEIAKIFASGAGKPQLWIGSEGWASTNRQMVRAKSYGYAPLFELTTVDHAVFLAQLKAAYEKKKPIVFYYWSPEWIFATYQLTQLAEPAFDGFATDDAKGTDRYNPRGCYTFYPPALRSDWLAAGSITCSEPPTRVNVAYSKALAQRAPKLAQFLGQVTLDAATVNAWILAAEVDKRDPDSIAKTWIAANQAQIHDVWLRGIK
jgi:glycine betaine/proline transport system substrate-binding protein